MRQAVVMAKARRPTIDAPIVLTAEPVVTPVSDTGSALRQVVAVLIASGVIVLGVRAIGPESSGLASPSVQIEFTDADGAQASTGSAHSPDWTALERGPLTPRWPAAIVWTGRELVVWGGSTFHNGQPRADGAAYDPATGEWRWLSLGPPAAQADVAWVWTDSELIMWSGEGQAAAWAPLDNRWREIREWPLQKGPAIWTGREIVDPGRSIAVDPQTGHVRPVSIPPGSGIGSGIVWTGSEILMLSGGAAYDPSTDTWRPLPGTGPSGTSVGGVWTGELAVAVDYLMNSASYDPAAATWASLPDVPLRFSGCAPRVQGARTFVVADLCGDIGLLHKDGSGWIPVSPPVSDKGNTLIVADGELYAWGEGFYQMSPGVLRGSEPPRRIALGISLLDLPIEWTVSSARLETPDRIIIDVVGPSQASCRAIAVHAVDDGTIRHLDDRSNRLLGPTDVAPLQTMHPFNRNAEDGGRLTWAASETDMIDITCNDSKSAPLLASGVFTP